MFIAALLTITKIWKQPKCPSIDEWIKQQTICAGKDVKKGNPFVLLVGMQIGAATVESSMEIPQRIKNWFAFDPVISLLGIYPKKAKTLIQKNICSPMFIAALFTIAKLWKQPKCPSTDEWIKQLWDIYTMEFYLAIKKKKILYFATVWMDLENVMLSEISQSEKHKYHMISLICGI